MKFFALSFFQQNALNRCQSEIKFVEAAIKIF
jgi:hypothetical protein